MSNWTLHSGGAAGADLAWAQLGKESGLPLEVIHWTPSDLKYFTTESHSHIDGVILHVAKVLGRPSEFKGKDFVRRNFFQADGCQALYAISTIIPPGGLDKGHINRSGKEVVAGGTGWTVEMAIQMGKPVYVFDQVKEEWYYWNVGHLTFDKCVNSSRSPIKGPTLTPSFAGIGSRNLLPSGIQAIKDCYTKTLESVREIN